MKASSYLDTFYVYYTVFPQTSTPPRRLLNFETEVRRLLEGGACYKVREMNNIKCQDFVIFSLNINNTFSALLLAY